MSKSATHRVLAGAVGTVLCLLGTACSSSKSAPASPSAGSSSMRMPASTAASPSSSSSSSSSSTAAAVTITIKNFGYTVSGPATVGAVVQVTNNDIEAHTVTADSGHAFAVTIQAGKTATFKAPTAAGSFTFHCDFHSNMHGTLTVSK